MGVSFSFSLPGASPLLSSFIEPGLNPTVAYIAIALASLMVGIAKSGFPTAGALISVPLIMLVMPAHQAAGLTLAIMLVGDVMAVYVHRHNFEYSYFKPIIIPTIAGLLMGGIIWYALLQSSTATSQSVVVIKQAVGVISIIFSIYIIGKEYYQSAVDRLGLQNLSQWVWGPIIGICSSIANVAGPVMGLYYFAKGLDQKQKFAGTMAWTFFIVNLLKIPLFAVTGVLQVEMIPVAASFYLWIPIGIVIGKLALNQIPQRGFNLVMFALSLMAGVALITRQNLVEHVVHFARLIS